MAEKETPKIEEIWVNDFTESSAKDFREKIVKASKEDPGQMITIYIDSYGGSVDALSKMIDTMDEVPNKFITVVMGKAMSCGAILLSHGDFRYAAKTSRMLIHRVSGFLYGETFAIKADADEILRLNSLFMELIAKNCNKTIDELEELLRVANGNQIILDPAGAKAFGLVDFIGTPQIVMKSYFEVSVTPQKEKFDPVLKKKILKFNTKPKKTQK